LNLRISELPFALDKPTFVIANISRLVGVTWAQPKRNQNAYAIPSFKPPLKNGPHGARMSTAVPTAETILVLGAGRK